MPRPRTPAPLALELDRDMWEQLPELLTGARELAQHPVVQAILTVMVNERPTAGGGAVSLDYALGYESALSLLRALLTGRVREVPQEAGEPTYESEETVDQLKWK